MPRFLSLFVVVTTCLLSQIVVSMDNILLPFERFQYDLEHFLPVLDQEVEFAELAGLTDDQAYEQLKSFFPTLQIRLQELRNMGVLADENRRKHKELADKMCGQMHMFTALRVDHKMRNILEVISKKRVTVANNLKMLTEMREAVREWGQFSKMPCVRALGK